MALLGSLLVWWLPVVAQPAPALRVQRDPETGALGYRPVARPPASGGSGVQRIVQPDGTVIYVFGEGTLVSQHAGPAVLDRRTLSDGTVVYDFGPASFVEMRAHRSADGRLSVDEHEGAADAQGAPR